MMRTGLQFITRAIYYSIDIHPLPPRIYAILLNSRPNFIDSDHMPLSTSHSPGRIDLPATSCCTFQRSHQALATRGSSIVMLDDDTGASSRHIMAWQRIANVRYHIDLSD